MKTISYLYISIICFFLFFFLTIFIINGNHIFFDDSIYNFLRTFSLTPFFQVITNFGSAYVIVPVVILTFLLEKKKNYRYLFLALVLLNTVANFVLKLFFGRSRPFYERLTNASGFSFPSGHAMASVMCYGLLIYLLWQLKISKILKIIGTGLCLFFIISISLSRIYLGVHYASDVLGGILASLFLLNFGLFFFETTKKKA